MSHIIAHISIIVGKEDGRAAAVHSGNGNSRLLGQNGSLDAQIRAAGIGCIGKPTQSFRDIWLGTEPGRSDRAFGIDPVRRQMRRS
jgi:hypothetical protein